MRLRRLELQGFRNYGHLVLDFPEGRTLFLGENGTGKSTIIDAIQWALTGQCRGVDGKGAGQNNLIKLGHDSTTVTAVIDKLGPVSRTISRGGSASSSMPPDVVLAKLDATPGMMAVVLSGRLFFTQHHAEAKAMLMQVLNVTIPKAKLPGIDLPDTVEFVDLAYLEQLYDQAFRERAAAKSGLAGVFVPEPPKVVNIDLGGKTLKAVQQQLARDQKDRLDAVRDQSKAEAELTRLQNLLRTQQQAAAGAAALGGNLKAHQDMLVEHQAQLATAQDGLKAAEAEPAEPTSALEIQLREAATLIDKIDRHRSAIIPVAAIPKSRKAAAKVADRPAEAAHACVLGGGIPCLTAASEFTGAIEQLKASQKDLEVRIRAGGERNRKIAAATQAVKESERHVTYHQAQLRDVEGKIAAAEQAAADVPATQDAISIQDTAVKAGAMSIGERGGAIDRQQQQVAELAAYEQAQQNHQAAADRKAELQKNVDRLESLVTLLGPKGLRLQALNDALADFHAAVNAALEPFGFEVAINVDPWRVEVNRQGTGWLPFDLLSKGQQLWTALAFQMVLAILSGLDFVVVDDAEAVVGLNRAVLTELILGSPVGQVLVAMAKSDEEGAPDIEGLQVVRLGQTDATVIETVTAG